MTPKPTATPDTPPPAEAPANPFEGLVRGRIVLYWPLSYEARNADPGPWPAMVTNVSAEIPGQVTLNINMPVPTPVGDDPVARRTEVQFSFVKDGPAAGCWTWMFGGQGTRYIVGVDPAVKG